MRLVEAAKMVEQTTPKITAFEWLNSNNAFFELRKRGKKSKKHLNIGFDNKPIKDCYLPHIPIDAQVYARTWKAFNSLKKSLGRMTTSEVWEHDILPMIENVVRKMKEVK